MKGIFVKYGAKIGMGIVALNVVGYTIIEINGAVDHLSHSNWDIHANFHATSGLLWLLTLFVVATYILWRFVSRGEIWAIWIVTFIGIGVFGGAVGSDPITRGGLRDGETALATGVIAYWTGWLSLVSWVAGMALVWWHGARSRWQH